MEQYCEKIPISGNIRLDLFTAVSFRVRISSLNGEPFPEQFEIPFAVGKVTPWEPVPYEADHVSDSTMVVVKTAKSSFMSVRIRERSWWKTWREGGYILRPHSNTGCSRTIASSLTVQIFGARRRTVPAMLIGFIITRRVHTISC